MKTLVSVICMNRVHFLNDWMFGFVNVVGDESKKTGSPHDRRRARYASTARSYTRSAPQEMRGR